MAGENPLPEPFHYGCSFVIRIETVKYVPITQQAKQYPCRFEEIKFIIQSEKSALV